MNFEKLKTRIKTLLVENAHASTTRHALDTLNATLDTIQRVPKVCVEVHEENFHLLSDKFYARASFEGILFGVALCAEQEKEE